MTRRRAVDVSDADGAGRGRVPWSLLQRDSAGIRRLLLALLVFGAAVQPAFAQGAWTGRGRVDVNVGAQVDTTRLSESLTLTKYVEPAPVSAELPNAAVPFFDAGVAVRLAGSLGLGVTVSFLTNTAGAEVRAQIPHPFYFGQARQIAGQVSSVTHRELATHTDLLYLLVFPRFDVAMSGGASFFRVQQSFVSDVIYAEAYPYDTASFVDATLTSESKSAIGYNIGVDITWKVAPRWGVGGMIRYAHARVPFTIGEADASADAGGLQAGGGLRFGF